MRIKILDPLIANQIAAGEVVDRPASIVKELLENSLDAGATEIAIDIERGGSQLIRIKDNGCGIHKDDLALAVQRHGTSKITNIEDLNAIASLGFRGEALASVCSVAKVKIMSLAHDANQAWELQAAGTDRKLIEKPVAHPQGTTVEVRDLFFNTPVRRKFLKTEKTEFSHIEEVVKRIALANFNLRLQLCHDEKQVLQFLPATSDIHKEKRIASLCGKEFMIHALVVDFEATGLRLWGWVASPEFSRSQQDLQYLYINGRIVRDKLLNHAVRQAYAEKLEYQRFPAFILFLECEPSLVDVNVHPTKHEVRYREGRLIHDFVYKSLRKVLAHENETIFVEANSNYSAMAPSKPTVGEISEHIQNYNYLAEQTALEPEAITKPCFLLRQRYIFVEAEEGVSIIDVLKARTALFNDYFENKKNMTPQPLLFPQTLILSKLQMSGFDKYSENLQALGFDIALMGETQLSLRAAPKCLQDVDFQELFSNLLEATVHRNVTAALAQRAPYYIKKPLSQLGMTNLLKQLESLPTGKKSEVTKHLSLKQLQNMF